MCFCYLMLLLQCIYLSMAHCCSSKEDITSRCHSSFKDRTLY